MMPDNKKLSLGSPHAFDLFVSHNRAQKAWVRDFVAFLRGLGLTIFFDEDSIQPGQDFALAIEEAAEKSRVLALIISPSAIGSRWVSLETALRLIENPLGEKKVVIPILTEHIERSELRQPLQRLDPVDLTNPATREQEFVYFLRALGVPEEKCCPIAKWPQPTGIEDLHIADINSVISAGWSGTDLLERLIAIDYEVFSDLTAAHEGEANQWAPVFMNHPDTWRLLTTESRDIVGYWHFVPLFAEEYKMAWEGELIDSTITPDRIPLFELAGTYDIYFVSIGVLPQYRRPKAVALLLDSLSDVLTDLAAHGVEISKVCANAYTADGVGICRSLGMRRVGPHRERGEIYEATMADLLSTQVARRWVHLRQAYNLFSCRGGQL